MVKRKKIYYGEIQDIFGYGISALGNSRKEVMDTLRMEYERWKKHHPDADTNFKTSFERFGGWVDEVEIGKGYHEGLRS
jgi:hypothetical protein